jgi:hypothetical protein
VLLQIRVSTPPARTDEVRALFENNAGTAHLAVLVGASVAPPGDLVLADVAREAADGLVIALRELRIDRDGGISLETVDATISRRAEEAERNAPGEGADAVIWEQVVRTTDGESSLSAFVAHLGQERPLVGVFISVTTTWRSRSRSEAARSSSGRPPSSGSIGPGS